MDSKEKRKKKKETSFSSIEEEIKIAKEKKREEKKEENIKEDKEIEKEFNNDINILNDNTSTKSKFNIFLLILSLIALIGYGIYFYFSHDIFHMEKGEIIKTLSFFLISFLIILILFKVNTKKTIPYLLILTLVFMGYLFFQVSYASEEVALENDMYVKDFINKDIVEVIEWCEKYNLNLTTLHEYSDTVPYNHVIMQEYGITKKIADIKDFTVTISDGPNYDKEVLVSNLTGLSYDEVMKYIEDNYLHNVEIEFIKSDKPKDTVIEQTGSGTMKRNDLIKLVFSYGEEIETEPVKDLKGLTLFEATSYLKRYGIPYEINYQFDDKVSKDKVINQNIIEQIVEDKLILTVSNGKEITIPNLLNMSNMDISKWASKNNIKIKYLEEYNKEIENGNIIRIDKQENEKIAEGSTIVITLSKGSLIMPKINNIGEFKLWAVSNNIHYEENYEFSNTIKNGELIKATPEEGQKISDNDTIVLTISKGKSVVIPNLVGLTKTNIQSKCKEVGLTCTFTYGSYTETTKRDISLSQSKKAGLTVASGTNVLITLSSGIYEKVTIPSFTGQSKSQITNTCNSLGITCNFKYNSNYSNQEKDTAISQDKTGTVNKGATVNITLSIGSAQTYTVVIDGSLLSLGNPEQTKNTLKSKLESACPGVNFNFSFKAVNSGIGYLNPDSQVKVGSNTFTQGKTYNVIINSN